MKSRALLGAALLLVAGSAMAQTTHGYGTIIRVPVVANTATFATTLYVHNPGGADTTVHFDYYGGQGSALPGARDCGQQVIPAGQTVTFNVGTVCALGGGSNFGQMELWESNTDNRPFAVYSRTQAFSGDGFSVEGFPVGTFNNPTNTSRVVGLRRQAAAPGYQTNCFVAAMHEAVTVNLQLRTSAGANLGSAQNYVLGANEMIRLLDVFTQVGAPGGDHSNVVADFFENGAGEPSFSAFCTVQNNTTFDADFRIAKDRAPADDRSRQVMTSSTSGMGAALVLGQFDLQHVHGMYLQHPDWVSCAATGAQAAGVEMRLKDPSGNVVVGGDGINSFGEVYLGNKSTRNNGVNGLWTLEVEASGLNGVTPPVTYGISCTSGNGANRPLLLGTEAQEF